MILFPDLALKASFAFSLFPVAAVINYPNLRLKTTEIHPYSSGVQKSKIKVEPRVWSLGVLRVKTP